MRSARTAHGWYALARLPSPKRSRFGIAQAGATLVLALAVAGILSSFEARAARPPGDPTGINELEDRRNEVLVRRIQRALSELGLYRGPISGVLDDATQNAIRAYEQHTGVEVTGRISEAIAEQIETAVRVQGLLLRLDEMRKAHMDAARQALLAHPATRDLVTGEQKEAADPTRDSRPCFREPTARCLLREVGLRWRESSVKIADRFALALVSTSMDLQREHIPTPAEFKSGGRVPCTYFGIFELLQ